MLKAHSMLVALDAEAAELQAAAPVELSRADRERVWREALPDIPDTLKFTRVPITVQEDCARRYAVLGSVITDDMICAGALNETEDDACQVSMTALPVC